ncbi:MAG: T9SS type A sorting domain-containing protein [Flavobacteriales bacterium]|nr:T9SS type A sorting domain-containing protein [Flavobacteriales bacterium]
MKYLLHLFAFLSGVQMASAQWQLTNYSEAMDVEDIFFLTEDVGYVVGYHEVYRTTDGGDSWSLVVENLFGNGPRLVHFINENVGFIAGSNSGGTLPIEVARTINGGASWTVTQLEGNQYTFSYGRDLFFLDDNTGFLACNGGSLYRTTDQGLNWVRVYNDANEDFSAIHFPSPAVGYMIPVYGGEIYRTINGGNSWSAFPLGQNIDMYDVYFTDNQTGYIAASNARILRTTDGGLNWTTTDLGASDAFMAIIFTSANRGYAIGSHGTLVTTTNAGETWVPQTSGVPDNLMCISFPSDSVGYIGTAGYPHVLKTTNGGGILGMDAMEEHPAISVYPVPSSGLVQVSSTVASALRSTYRLFNAQGMLMQTGKLAASHRTIDLQTLPAGIYLLQLDAYPSSSIRLVRK